MGPCGPISLGIWGKGGPYRGGAHGGQISGLSWPRLGTMPCTLSKSASNFLNFGVRSTQGIVSCPDPPSRHTHHKEGLGTRLHKVEFIHCGFAIVEKVGVAYEAMHARARFTIN